MKKIVALAVLAMVATSSMAGTPGAMYAGIDGGSTRIEGLPGKEASYGAFFGYSFHRHFALEAGVRRLGKWHVRGNEIKSDQISLSVLGGVPVGRGLSLYGRLGANRVKTRTCSCNKSTTGVLYGLGLGYEFSETVFARVEAQKPTRDSTNVSIGVGVQF
ncbi:MAG TPA: outer membrane beta-barrel protein [Telluria sp.]